MSQGDGPADIVVPAANIVQLAADLVTVPSQGGIDASDAILERMAQSLRGLRLAPEFLSEASGRPVALVCRIDGRTPGPALCLNACLDTAPFGDLDAWSFSPLEGRIVGRKLRGRGAADSKTGAAILAHVGAHLAARPGDWVGTLYLLFDADEHTGQFGGVQRFIEAAVPRPRGVVLGYPGHDALIVGARGFFRAKVTVFGTSAHSGARQRTAINAVGKLARLISWLERAELPGLAGTFPHPPVLSVTRVEGGSGYSQIPDKASCGIDIRTTPEFGDVKARCWLVEQVRTFDVMEDGARPSSIVPAGTWPAYALEAGSRLVHAFQEAGGQAFGKTIATDICGPSNIGNYLATQGVETICGLGVGYANLHAVDEIADVGDIDPSFRAYLGGALSYLSPQG